MAIEKRKTSKSPIVSGKKSEEVGALSSKPSKFYKGGKQVSKKEFLKDAGP